MNGNCCGTSSCGTERRFLTKKEKAEMLKEYRTELENELKGINEKIAELEGK
ncbi:DUF5320 domain-containing protein [Candidatus Micrarchaeota archaeon]|nr:DUF5320 domain-containing protein [Candidatus Micrarchaeota archaeon]